MSTAPSTGQRIAIAMSGGLDSSVAAARLVEQGYDVVGVHMKLYDLPEDPGRGRSCCSLDDALDARQVAAQLGIPFYVLDFTAPFKTHVVDYFVQSYRQGLTPNPCVMCNQEIKNRLLLAKVREFGCDILATGHYAALRPHPTTGQPEIVRPADRKKDQTYFLFGTPASELPFLMFPLAEDQKGDLRQEAQGLELSTWDKPESMDVCFIPKDYRTFLDAQPGPAPAPGNFVSRNGQKLGTHQGLSHYTIGQRRGLGIAAPEPLYVLGFAPEQNEVVLGPESDLFQQQLTVSRVNWVSRPPQNNQPRRLLAKIRYSQEPAPATLTPLETGQVQLEFDEPVRAITPGQAAVFYEEDVLLGGGFIDPRPLTLLAEGV